MDANGEITAGRPKRDPLDVKNLYLVYFATFGGFCLSLIFDKKAHEALYNPVLASHAINEIIAGRHAIEGDVQTKTRQFCFQRVGNCWYWMDNLRLTFEQKCAYVTNSMENFVCSYQQHQALSKPVFKDLNSLKAFEKMWRENVDEPVFRRIGKIVQDLEANNELNELLEFSKTLKDSIDSSSVKRDLLASETQQLSILKQYQSHQEALKFSVLIPDIVEIYDFLHTKLAHLINEKDASETPVERILDSFQKVDKKQGKKIVRTYERLLHNWNDFLKYTGGKLAVGVCAEENAFPSLVPYNPKTKDGTVISALLTYSDGFNDLLSKMLKGIVKIHNNFLNFVETNLPQIENAQLYCCPKFSSIVSSQIPSIVSGSSSPVLIQTDSEGRLESFTLSQAFHNEEGRLKVNWNRVQQFILANFVNNKFKIVEETNKAAFKFKKEKKEKKEQVKKEDVIMRGMLEEVKETLESLPPSLSLEMEEENVSILERSVESKTKEELKEIIRSLLTIANLSLSKENEFEEKKKLNHFDYNNQFNPKGKEESDVTQVEDDESTNFWKRRDIKMFMEENTMKHTISNLFNEISLKKMGYLKSILGIVLNKYEKESSLFDNVQKCLKVPLPSQIWKDFVSSVDQVHDESQQDSLIKQLTELNTELSKSHDDLLNQNENSHNYEEKSLREFLINVSYYDENELVHVIPDGVLGKHVCDFEKKLIGLIVERSSKKRRKALKEKRKFFTELEDDKEYQHKLEKLFDSIQLMHQQEAEKKTWVDSALENFPVQEEEDPLNETIQELLNTSSQASPMNTGDDEAESVVEPVEGIPSNSADSKEEEKIDPYNLFHSVNTSSTQHQPLVESQTKLKVEADPEEKGDQTKRGKEEQEEMKGQEMKGREAEERKRRNFESWKVLLEECNSEKQVVESTLKVVEEQELEVSRWWDLVENEEMGSVVDVKFLERLRMLLERTKQFVTSGGRMRIRMQMGGMDCSKKEETPMCLKSWKSFFVKICRFEEEKASRYGEVMEKEDFYLCHWKQLKVEDLSDLPSKENEMVSYFLKNLENPSKGHEFREKLIKQKEIEGFEKSQVLGGFKTWKELFLKAEFGDLAEKFGAKMEEMDVFLCHWHLLDIPLLKDAGMKLGHFQKIKKLIESLTKK